MALTPKKDTALFNNIRDLLQQAISHIVTTVNYAMVATYFEVGRLIVEDEQEGAEKAEYGAEVLKELSGRLNEEFGKGFSVDNLENMRRFYLAYGKQQTLSDESKQLEKSETLSRKFKLEWNRLNKENTENAIAFFIWEHVYYKRVH